MTARNFTPAPPVPVRTLNDTAFRAIADEAIAKIAAVEALVDGVIIAAFNTARVPRSLEYQDGVRALLLYRALARAIRTPFVQGTAQSDVFFAGIEEGKALWRSQVEATLAQHHARQRPAANADHGTA